MFDHAEKELIYKFWEFTTQLMAPVSSVGMSPPDAEMKRLQSLQSGWPYDGEGPGGLEPTQMSWCVVPGKVESAVETVLKELKYQVMSEMDMKPTWNDKEGITQVP